MRRLTLLKILLISVLGSCFLCVLAFLSLRSIEASSGFSHQQELATRIARDFEVEPVKEALDSYGVKHAHSPFGRTKIWAVDGQDQLIGGTSNDPLPFEWNDSCKPLAVHDIAVHSSIFSLTPDYTCIRLETKDPTYLVIYLAPRKGNRVIWETSFLFIFLTVAIAVFLSLTLTFFYLQRKSREAKSVLSKIQQGDLEARFEIKQFDEIGSLMLDFNRMADALRELVLRVRNVEQSRRNLLRELSHDIRTPLTSLKTSLETLRQEESRMSAEDRTEFFSLAEAELNYLGRLFEDLFFITDLDEPRFKTSSEQVDVLEVLKSEIRGRQQQSDLDWHLDVETGSKNFNVAGDLHLIRRLFKNALENAGRFAKGSVKSRIQEDHQYINVQINDDGPGLTPQALENFGKRRQSRSQPAPGSSHLSLGLGSVIMRSIAELHGGSVEIQNIVDGAHVVGARLTIQLKK